MRFLVTLIFGSAVLICGHAALAQSTDIRSNTDKPIKIEDGYGDAFVNYQPYITPAIKKQERENKEIPVPAPRKAEDKRNDKESVDVAWLRQNYPVLEERAINNPTKENVEAQLYVRRVIFDKSQRYQEMVQRVTNDDPLLNENNRIPYASSGAQSIQNANYLAQEKAVRELAEIGGAVIFIDGNCRFCVLQLPIINMLKNNLGLEYLVVSIDGTYPKSYKGDVKMDNGLYKKLGLKLTPSIVYISRPKSYVGTEDPNQYLVISQGYYAQDELIKQIAYAGHKTGLLSKTTMKDLDVWDRGVANTKDLEELKLDPNKPETIKKTLEPLLLKQY